MNLATNVLYSISLCQYRVTFISQHLAFYYKQKSLLCLTYLYCRICILKNIFGCYLEYGLSGAGVEGREISYWAMMS